MMNPWRGFLFDFEGFGDILGLFGRVRLCASGDREVDPRA